MTKNEKKLTLADLQKMKPGDQIVASLMGQDMAMAFSCKMKEAKYSTVINKTDDKTLTKYIGKRVRSLGLVDGKMKYVLPEEEDCKPDAKTTIYTFMGFGSLEIKDHDADEIIKNFNVRIITKDHPKYSSELAKTGKGFSVMMKGLTKIFGED